MDPVSEQISRTGDEITLTIPRDQAFHHVAQLVLGGMAARLDVTYENLDDLEVGLAALLERADEEGELTVTLRSRGDAFEARVGPFHGDTLRRELEREVGEDVGLRRVLETVVDDIELDEEDGEQWVGLRKKLGAAGGAV
jgi:hypothetical protein